MGRPETSRGFTAPSAMLNRPESRTPEVCECGRRQSHGICGFIGGRGGIRLGGLTNLDYIKLAGVGPIFFILGPALGFLLTGKPRAQLWVFGIMCFMTINGLLAPGNWGLTLMSIEEYRGHTKGFHFYFNHALAIALIVAKWRDDRRSFRWIPPGLGWYLLYCGLSLLSLTNAPEPYLGFMAAHKQIFASLITIATFNTLRTEADFRFFMRAMVVTLAWELLVCIKMKYGQGMYQVHGTFEHQNPLAMYAELIGMVFLATTLGPTFKGANWILFGYLMTGIIVEFTLSRGALVMFGLGTVMVATISLAEKLTPRRIICISSMAVIGGLGLLLTLDTIIARFNDKGNDSSGELREVMKTACRAMVSDHPLGIGWNNYALVVNPPYPYAEIYYEWIRGLGQKVDETLPNSVVESHYYLLLAETGYVGLFSWLAVISIGLYRNVRAFFFFKHSFLRCLSLGIFVGCLLNYEQSTLERVLVQPRNLMLWLVLLGITGRIEIMRREAKAARKAGLDPATGELPEPTETPALPA